MRRLALALLLVATAAQAQTPLTGTTGAPLSPQVGQSAPMGSAALSPQGGQPDAAGRRHHQRRKLQERFEDANTTHDGRLTLEQARAKMPAVARDFDAIDTDRKGYVTVEQIKAYRHARRAARRAAKGH